MRFARTGGARLGVPRRGRWIATLLLAALTVVAGCSSPTSSSPGGGFVESKPGLTRVEPSQRRVAPVSTGTDLDGNPLSTERFRGKVVVLNVWGSWCNPCRAEAPHLVEVAERTRDVAQFVGLNTRDLDPAPARAFVRTFKINYPSIYDPSGAELLKYTDIPPAAIPSTLILDREGRVAARVIGQISQNSLVQLIDDIAAGK